MNDFSENEYKPTKSLIYILPMLEHSYEFYGSSFYNCYIDAVNDYIYLVFRKPFDNIFYFTESIIIENSNYQKVVTDNKIFKIYKFKIPTIYINDFNQFVKGKYSKMSSKYKQYLLSVYEKNKYYYNDIKKTLYPTKMDRITLMRDLEVTDLPGGDNAEVTSVPNLKEEQYDNKRFFIKNNKYKMV